MKSSKITIKQPKFLGSFPNIDACPKLILPEFAFIGRSNVGKSSLLNAICERNSLAKTSGTPGKTRLINLFNIDLKWVLADLPGYGYAKLSKHDREKFINMIKQYLHKRENLFSAFLLMDLRVAPQSVDLEMADWLGENSVPFCIVFTKADKLKPAEIETQIKLYEEKLFESWAELPHYFITSSKTKEGREAIMQFIQSAFPANKKSKKN